MRGLSRLSINGDADRSAGVVSFGVPVLKVSLEKIQRICGCY